MMMCENVFSFEAKYWEASELCDAIDAMFSYDSHDPTGRLSKICQMSSSDSLEELWHHKLGARSIFFLAGMVVCMYDWIGLRENLQETIDFPIKYGAFL